MTGAGALFVARFRGHVRGTGEMRFPRLSVTPNKIVSGDRPGTLASLPAVLIGVNPSIAFPASPG